MTVRTYPHVSIIILNWNGLQDTIECLESVFKLKYPNFSVLLVDNHSENDSVRKISQWASGSKRMKIRTNFPSIVFPEVEKPIDFYSVPVTNGKYNKTNIPSSERITNLFILNDRNLGFSKANNLAVEIANRLFQSRYFFLLNNDTVIVPNALDRLIEALEKQPIAGVAQATIYSYYSPGKIENAGGKIFFWGQTKYYKSIHKGGIKNIGFINGCALCIHSGVIEKYGALSDQFFFGEEDFEYSMRLTKKGVRMICVADSIVYHKVGASSAEYLDNDTYKKVMLFALNRIVDMKNFMNGFIWRIWRVPTLFYFYLLLTVKYKNPFGESLTIINLIRRSSKGLDNVQSDTVEKLLSRIDR